MAELAKPNPKSSANSRPSAPSRNGSTSPYLALLIEVGVPLALVVLIAIAMATVWPISEIELPAAGHAADVEANVYPVENSLTGVSLLPRSWVGLSLGQGPRMFTRGSDRLRLGDTLYGGRTVEPRPLRKPWTTSHLFFAAVTDDRVAFRASAPPSVPLQKRSEAGPRKSLSAIAFHALPRLRYVGYVQPTPEVQQMNPAAQTAMPPQSQMPASAPAKLPSPPLNAAPQIAQPAAATTPQIVTAATMTALLQADARGIRSIEIDGWDLGLSNEDYSKAVVSGVARLFDRLSSLTQIFVPEALSNDRQIDPEVAQVLGPPGPWRRISIPPSAWLLRLFATPLPLPGGTSLIEPQTINFKTLPANLDSLVNPIYRVTPASTRLPSIVFPLIGFFALFVSHRRYTYATRGISIRGFIDGAALAVGLVATLAVLWHFWRWFPESWLASASGLTCVALAAGALEGGLLAALHHAPLASQPEKDTALRTVLDRDIPVDDIARDRLGFASLVDALRRFLDNPATAPPVVLSVNGPWGSGKSSVMKMLSHELKKTRRFRIVWFNAWQYHREEQILAAFLQTICRQLSAQWGPVFALRLGWARWKNTSLLRQVAVVAVLAIVAAGILRPDLRDGVASAIKADSKSYGAVVQLFLGGASIGTLGGLIWAVNILWPFRLSFGRFFQATDQSRRVGFIDEFTREFRLYRDAVGNQKFLFFVDDLDRCQPDRVVDVLKAINLIITSADEAGRSFFMLGYDQRYIVEAVEKHFADLAKTAHEPGERFGLQYLKKMVTLSVSVPQPSAKQVQELLKRIDAEREPVAVNQTRDLPRLQRLGYAAQKSARQVWRTIFARQAALIFGFVALALFLVMMPRAATTPVGPAPSVAGSSPNQSPPPAPASGRETIEMPSPAPPLDRFSALRWWAIPVLLLLSAVAALYVANRPESIEAAYRREPEDSAKFVNAVEWCKDLLPKNPRDAIRMVNLMRMEYLVQESDKAPLDGSPLDEWECVSFTILQKRHPALFRKLLTDLDGAAAGNGTDAVRFSLNGDPALASDVSALRNAGGDTSHIESIDKLKRFVAVNRFLLEAEV